MNIKIVFHMMLPAMLGCFGMISAMEVMSADAMREMRKKSAEAGWVLELSKEKAMHKVVPVTARITNSLVYFYEVSKGSSLIVAEKDVNDMAVSLETLNALRKRSNGSEHILINAIKPQDLLGNIVMYQLQVEKIEDISYKSVSSETILYGKNKVIPERKWLDFSAADLPCAKNLCNSKATVATVAVCAASLVLVAGLHSQTCFNFILNALDRMGALSEILYN